MVRAAIIKITGLKEYRRKDKAFKEKNVARRTAKSFAQDVVLNLKNGAPVWTGELRASIQSRQTSAGYSVTMVDYGAYVDQGTGPIVGKPAYWPSSQGSLPIWGAHHGFFWPNLKKSIHFKGTEPHPFVESAFSKSLSKFTDMTMLIVRNTLKEAGFNERKTPAV